MRDNEDHGDRRRSSQKKSIATQGNIEHQSVEERNASVERGMQSAFELSQSVVAGKDQALSEQERRDREIPERADQAPKLDPNALLFGEAKPDRFVFGAETDNEMRDDMTELEVHQSDEEGSTERGTDTGLTSPATSRNTSEDTSEGEPERGVLLPPRLRAKLDNMRKLYATASRRKPFEKTEVSSPDGEASQQPATPPAAPLTTADRPADGEASQQPAAPATPAASDAVPAHEGESQPRPAQAEANPFGSLKKRLKEKQEGQKTGKGTAASSVNGGAGQQRTTPQKTANSSFGEGASQRQTTPQKTANSSADGGASQQRTTPQKTENSSANGEASQQRTTPQGTPKSPADRKVAQQQTTPPQTPSRPTHGTAIQRPATPAAPNAAPEHNPFAPQGPMTFNLPGRGLEDLGPQGVLGQLAATRHAPRTNTPQPPAPSPPQPSPVAPEAPGAGEHNPFTERRGPPSFPNLANPGPESPNTQNTLGQRAADPPAAPANRRLPAALAEMNEAVVRFEAYRQPPPSPPDDSSSSWLSSSDEDEEDGSMSESMSGSIDWDGDRVQALNRDMPRIRIVSPAASPTRSDDNRDEKPDSSEYQLAQPDRRGVVDADSDSDSTLSDLDEGEFRRRMALYRVGAGHDSDTDDEESHIPNHGGRDSDYEASTPTQNRTPENRGRSSDSPLRLGNHRVVEPVRNPNPSQILRSIRSPLFNSGSAMADGGPRLGNHEVVTPANNPFFRPAENPFRQGNSEAERQVNNPFFRLGSAMAGVNHQLPHTAPSWWQPLQQPAVQPTDAATIFAEQFRNTPAPWVTYTRSLNERGAAFTRDFGRDDLGFREGREVTPLESARATLIRQAERHPVTPVVWRVSPRVVKRVPQRAGLRSEGLIGKLGNRRSKPEKSGTETSASRSQTGSEPRSPRSDYLTRPFRRVLEEQVQRHAEHNPFIPPSPEPESPPEQWEPEQKDEQKEEQNDKPKVEQKDKPEDEDEEMRRLIAEVKELDAADQELFREVMLETEARAEAGLDVSDFFGPLARSLGGRARERRGSYTRCAPTTESMLDTDASPDAKSPTPTTDTTPDTEASLDVKSPTPSDPVTEASPRPRSRRPRRRPANTTYPSRPFSDPNQTPRTPELPPYSPSETTVQTIRRFPLRLARQIEDGNIDGIQLFLRMLMVLILIWVAFEIAMGDGEDHEVHWYVARGEPQMWQAGS